MSDNSPAKARQALVRRGAVLLPIVLASTSWTVSVAGVGGVPAASGSRPAPAALAEPVVVPDQAVEPPASVALQGLAAKARPSGVVRPVVDAASIPATALAAYQRAAVVIGSADKGCHLEWPVVAAIGKVESDHGRVGGSALGADGVADPSIVGLRLNGRRGTARISDTDGGRYDGDRSFDRAVGPMQFVPTTWGVVGVDADGDGRRDPQDVDDAALATAVYLCSGEGDLAAAADLRRAVLRYNHSQRYVDLVLAQARAYAEADRQPLAAAGYDVPVDGPSANPGGGGHQASAHAALPPVKQDRPAPAAPKPAAQPGHPKPDAPPSQSKPAESVTGLLTRAQAVLSCVARGLTQLLQPVLFDECVTENEE